MLLDVGLIFVSIYIASQHSLLFVSGSLTKVASVSIVGNGTIPGTVVGSMLGGSMPMQYASSDRFEILTVASSSSNCASFKRL